MYAKSSAYNGGLGPMPLLTHCEDTAAIAIALARQEPPKVLKHAAKVLGCTVDEFICLVAFLAALHDIAKASPHYEQWYSSGKQPNRHPELAHDMMGEWLMMQWLAARGAHIGWASVIGSHHGWTSQSNIRRNPYAGNEKVLGDARHEEARREILDLMFERYQPRLDLVPDLPCLMVVSGLVVEADWRASALEPTIEDHTPERAVVEPKPKWTPTDRGFTAFGHDPRPFQQMLMNMVSDKPSLYICNVPPGEGKSKAALALAEQIALLTGAGGVFFGLPTRATANMVHDGVFGEWAGEVCSQTWLAHSSAKLNELYMSRDNAHGNKHQLRMLAPMVLGTVDQLLMGAVRDKHQMTRHRGLAGKVIIIDEVHCYDPHMSKMLDSLLGWLAAYGCTVIILSATLTPSRRSELVKAYTGRTEEVPSGLVRADADETVSMQPEWSRLPTTFVVEHANDPVDVVLREVERGANVLVVRNTVRKAKETYEELKQHISDVTLLHSRFSNKHRADKESAVFKRHGSEVTERPRGAVLVATQVVEQSADIDFDVLVTDLCPTDLLIQRSGRAYRNRDVERTVEARIVIVESNDDWLYSRWSLEQTRDVWRRSSSVTMPVDIESMMVETFEVDRHPELRKRHLDDSALARSVASLKLLGKPEGNTLSGLFPKTDDDMSVRMGMNSVEVTPLVDGRLLDGGDPNDWRAVEANSVMVPASWGMRGLVEIDPSQYSEETGLEKP